MSTAPDIRPIHDDEFAAWIDSLHVAFNKHGDPVAEADFRRPFTDLSRCLGAFEGGRIVGTFRSLGLNLSVPGGGLVDTDAITAVTVLPTHRRRGLLRTMTGRDLAAAAERGDPLAILIASEYPIYGRFGFGPATEAATCEVDVRATRFRGEPAGTVELVEPVAVRALLPELHEAFRRRQPGSPARRDVTWDVDLGLSRPPGREPWKGRLVLSRDPLGAPDGFLRYHVEERWDERLPRSTLHVDDLIATSPAAEARLWRFACSVDLVATVRAADRPVDELLPWLLEDARAVRTTHRADALWVRPLDVVAALAARRYLVDGRVVLEVHDPDGYAAGRFALEGGPAGATCVPTTEESGLVLPAEALGAAYLGGARLAMLAAAGRAEEVRPGALATADAMFRWSVAPWCATWF